MPEGHSLDLDTAVSKPSPARMYDYYLGGKDNYDVDREAAEQVIAQHPQQRQLALNNRAFLVRAVECLTEAGITQFIDIGTGIPTSPNVHEVARQTYPDARVVYVDDDPIVLAHNRALLETDDKVTTIEGDMRNPRGVLTSPELNHLIDFTEPVAVMLVSVLHFVPRGETAHIVSTFRNAMVAGSYLAASMGTSEGLTQEELNAIHGAYANATGSSTFRSRQEIEELFAGLDLLQPGLADVSQWRANEPETHIKILAGVGRKP